MIKGIAKCIVAFNGNLSRTQIAAGFSWGVLLGLVPSGNLLWPLLLIFSFFLRHHHGGKTLMMALIKLLFPLIALPLDSLGWTVLHIEKLEPFFVTLYNTPFVLFTRYNNTLVAGGLAAGIALFIPVFILMTLFVPVYRATLLPKILNSKIVKSFGKIPFISQIRAAVNFMTDAEIIKGN